MAVNMFRAVFLCVMLTVAQSEVTLTCIKMTATMGGGLCDGMTASLSACGPAGTPTNPTWPGAAMNAAACDTFQLSCAIGGGTANKDFCVQGATSGYCKQTKAALLSKNPAACSTDADCAKALAPVMAVGCCADYKTILGQMCTGIKDVDATITLLKGQNACADTNCFKMASAHSVRASSMVAIAPLLLSFAFFKF